MLPLQKKKKKAGEEDPEADEKKKEDPLGKQLHDGWLKGLIAYAPHVSCLASLFENEDFKVQAENLVENVAAWVGSYTWNKILDLETLSTFLASTPALLQPEIPAYLVGNHGCDDMRLFSAVWYY